MDTVITNIGQLITPVEAHAHGERASYTLEVSLNETLYVRDGRIIATPSGHAASDVQTFDAGGGVVMPGLIDPFWVMPKLPPWIDELPDEQLPEKDLLNWSLRLLRMALRTGVTTTEVKCPHDAQFLALAALGHLGQQRYPRVVGTLLATLPEVASERDRSLSSLIGEIIPAVRSRRLATFCDIAWGSYDGYVSEARAVLRAASGAGLRPKIHIQAEPDMERARDLALSLDVASMGCASYLSPAIVKHLSDCNVLPVYMPGLLCGELGKYVNARKLLDQDVAVAIGSGNGLSESPLQSMWAVLAAAIAHMDMTLHEVIVAATLHNAMALELSHETGSLEIGKRADLIVLDLIDYRELAAVIAAPPVSMVMVHGEVAYSR